MYWEELMKEYTLYKKNADNSKTEVKVTPSKNYIVSRLKERKSMEVFIDRIAGIEDMSDAEAGRYIKSLYSFVVNLDVPPLPDGSDRFLIQMYRSMVTERIILDRKYIQRCMQNALNKIEPTALHRLVTIGNDWKQLETDMDTDTDTAIGTDTDKGTDIGRGIRALDSDEVSNYIISKGYDPAKIPQYTLECALKNDDWKSALDSAFICYPNARKEYHD